MVSEPPSIQGLAVVEHFEYETLASPQRRPSHSGAGGAFQSPTEVVPPSNPSSLDLAKIAADSRIRPNQALVDTIDGVRPSVFQHFCPTLMCIPDAGRRDV